MQWLPGLYASPNKIYCSLSLLAELIGRRLMMKAIDIGAGSDGSETRILGVCKPLDEMQESRPLEKPSSISGVMLCMYEYVLRTEYEALWA